jgi:hypothetical protein
VVDLMKQAIISSMRDPVQSPSMPGNDATVTLRQYHAGFDVHVQRQPLTTKFQCLRVSGEDPALDKEVTLLWHDLFSMSSYNPWEPFLELLFFLIVRLLDHSAFVMIFNCEM